ncbi:MFS transporter [Phreatobacter oligotrophus]|uniref:MFS transporter n=1 Tax=Phreatobacter oligotrophus TaxID=1122261 RepID=UPI002354611A|nr:MFS transporter [Phreatobacter oligotrophus]MBX9991272.1 MFS transporter [Phreatobacter oligotrophus]
MIALALGTIGGVGMWSVVVVMPAVQADFGTGRGAASLPYTLAMLGFAGGGVLMGRVSDRYGIMAPVIGGSLLLGTGYLVAGLAPSIWVFALAHGLLIGLGSAAVFGPLLAHVSFWFDRRRGIAVAIAASGNYLAGAVWPQVVRFTLDAVGWRMTHIIIAVTAVTLMVPLALLLRQKPPAAPAAGTGLARSASPAALGLSPNVLMVLLAVAGVACCVAMSMPQVHIVAYCADLGYGVARGSEMLSLMLAFGIISRVASGFVADRIGGLATLLLGSTLQGVALLMFLTSDALTPLYIFSILFGLFQGGIVPSYAIIVREYFSPGEAGTRVGIALMATLLGMAFGGWISGVIYDLTRSYQAAFINGILWNLINLAIVGWLLMRRERLARA